MANAARKARTQTFPRGTIGYEYKHLDYEPLMLQFIMLLKESGKATGFVVQNTGISYGTIKNWEKRKTRRPNASTLRFAYKSLGYRLGPIKER